MFKGKNLHNRRQQPGPAHCSMKNDLVFLISARYFIDQTLHNLESINHSSPTKFRSIPTNVQNDETEYKQKFEQTVLNVSRIFWKMCLKCRWTFSQSVFRQVFFGCCCRIRVPWFWQLLKNILFAKRNKEPVAN